MPKFKVLIIFSSRLIILYFLFEIIQSGQTKEFLMGILFVAVHYIINCGSSLSTVLIAAHPCLLYLIAAHPCLLYFR